MENKYNEHMRVKGVAQYMGMSVSSVWLFSKRGELNPIKLSDRVTVWRLSDIDAFITSRATAGGAV